MTWSRRAARPPFGIGDESLSMFSEAIMAAPDDPSNPKAPRDREEPAAPAATGVTNGPGLASASATSRDADGPVVSRDPITQVVPTKTAADDDARFARAWRVWLEALAHDPEAAWAAALTYKSLGVEGREAWIEALAVDAPEIGAPAIALYAPLLGVEDDPGRRARIQLALMKHGAPAPNNVLRGLRGEAGTRRVLVIVHPLYLDFVEVLTCTVEGEMGFGEVRHDPIRLDTQAPAEGEVIEGAELETVPMELVIEELAHAVIAHKRHGGTLPPPLVRFADLFTPRPESVDREKLRGG